MRMMGNALTSTEFMARDGLLGVDDYKKLGAKPKPKKASTHPEPTKEKPAHLKWYYSTKTPNDDGVWGPDNSLIRIKQGPEG